MVAEGARAGESEKASHSPHAVPAGGRLATDSVETTPGAAKAEASPRPIITARAVAAKARVSVEQAAGFLALFWASGWLEPHGVLADGTCTYTTTERTPEVLVLRYWKRK